MKFTNGQWLLQKGVTVYHPVEVCDLEVEKNSMTVYASPKQIRDRGDTLDQPLLTMRFSSPLPDIIRVQMFHFKGQTCKRPAFEIHQQADCEVTIQQEQELIQLTTGNLTVRVQTEKGWAVDFFNQNCRITGSSARNAGYVIKESGQTFMKEQLDLGVGECVYGFGEHFTPFVKNGQVIDIWNEDGGTDSEQAYKNIPFYLTNKGYGVLVNHPEKVSFEVASERLSKVQFSVPGEYLEYFIINGPNPKEVIRKYTALTGRPALPPAWSFGLWLTTSFTTAYDEKTVQHFIDGMKDRDIPLQVFHFDCFWMKEYHWCNFEWDNRTFPDPIGLLARLKEKGLKICVWINPYIAQRSKLFDEGMANGYLLKKANGDIWQWDLWQAGMAIVDFTNPAACQWYAGYLRKLLDIGVDCFKTDFGERIPTDVVYFDGSDPIKMHNYYTYLYNKVVFELLEERFGKGRAAVFARSATVGSQQFPVHWGGDCWANYESMAESLRGGLSLCLSGFGYWSHDIGGFEKTASADLYKRWVAFGLLSSHSRLHGSSSYRVPWLFDEEAVDVLRFFTKLKCRLMPYLFSISYQAAQTGVPVMRAMFLEFPDDPACEYLDRQYMLGDSILVAPIFSQEGTVSYYLPPGKWTHFLTGEQVNGGCWRQEKHGYLSIPLWVRSNTILATGSIDNRPDYDYVDEVTFHIFNLEDGKSASTEIISMEGQLSLEVTVIRQGNQVIINPRGDLKSWQIYLWNHFNLESISGGSYLTDSKGIIIRPDPGVYHITFSLKTIN